MADGRTLSPEEQQQALAQELGPEERLAALLGDEYHDFNTCERFLAMCRQDGLIDQELYNKVRSSYGSFTQHIPAMARPKFMRGLGEMKNPTPSLIAVSRAAGVKLVNGEPTAILRKNVAGMDSKDIDELINSPLFVERMDWEGGKQAIELLATKLYQEGVEDDEDMLKIVEAAALIDDFMKKSRARAQKSETSG